MFPENEQANTATFTTDLEHGDVDHERPVSSYSIGDNGSVVASSHSSIMGSVLNPDANVWGPLHACYPHLNPHVPTDSTEYASTRIIRIRRDWLLKGDLAPTFSNLYPDILDPAGISEEEFRRIIEKLNSELIPAFNPFNVRNIMDSALGLATGWLWEDLGLTAVKSRLKNLERWIEQWNAQMAETVASSEAGAIPPRIISLRQTGYLSLDIQIPDPEIAPAPTSNHSALGSSHGLPVEPTPAMIAA